MNVIINGAGIAGPTLAYWLSRYGHEVLLVEKSPRIRTGGYVIDFWGAGYDIAEKMGLLRMVSELGYQVREVRFVDRNGRQNGGFSNGAIEHATRGRFTSLRRSDLAAIIYGAIDGKVETLFGDSIAGIVDVGDRVLVTFDHSAPREFDLVVGADGLHSKVRHLAFGPDQEFEVPLGYHIAAFETVGYRPRDELVYISHGVPGRQVSRFTVRDDRTLFLFMFVSGYMSTEPSTDSERRALLTSVFSDVGWECPRILASMEDADEIYFDRVSQIRMDHWSLGRTVLIGDAGACASLLAGEGAGLAMAEAYVLAGELHDGRGDPAAALAAYQERLMPFLRRKQLSAARFASAFAPRTSSGLWFRNFVTRLMRCPYVADFYIGRDLRNDIVLPDYEGGRTEAESANPP